MYINFIEYLRRPILLFKNKTKGIEQNAKARAGLTEYKRIDNLKQKELKELIKLEEELTMMFDSDVRVALALLDKIREIKLKIK